MPNFNQTGPMGQGPMTGQRMGRCTNFGVILKKGSAEPDTNENEELPEGLANRGRGWGPGRGFGCRGVGRGGGRGFGMGRQNRFRGGC